MTIPFPEKRTLRSDKTQEKLYSETEILQLLPLAASWIEEQEAFIMKNGSAPDSDILRDAGQLGINNLEKIRFLAVDQIPHPSDKLLSKAISDFGFIGSNTLGVAFRYGIYVRTSHRHDRGLFIHELVHTMQYERIGGILPFLKQYVFECIGQGYPNGSLEQEAIKLTKIICP